MRDLAAGAARAAVGVQDQGFAQSLGGIPIIADANVTTTVSTNQDKVYLLAKEDWLATRLQPDEHARGGGWGLNAFLLRVHA
jgi:hypothetical protein